MAIIFNIVLPVLAGLCILAMFFFIWRAFSSRYKSTHQAYNVGRQEAQRNAKVNLIRAVFAFLLALIFLAVNGVSPSTELSAPAPTPTPDSAQKSPSPEVTLVPTATKTLVTSEPSPTSSPPTATATPMPTVTDTPQPLTANVSSGVGIWLRDQPGTESEQLEWLLEGTTIIVLPGEETADDFVWRQVQTDQGLIGWVASDFIIVNEP